MRKKRKSARPDRSADDDNSETLSVRITVPSDGTGPVGALTGATPAGVTLTNLGGGVYTVTATGPTAAAREVLLDGYLTGGITFTPRAQWSGNLTGANGIRVDAISTESATGSELAPGSYGGPDGTSKTETATTFIGVTVNPIGDLPVQTNAATTVQENNNSTAPADPDLVVPIGARIVAVFSDGLMEESERINETILIIMQVKMKHMIPIIIEGQQKTIFTNSITSDELIHIVMGTFRVQMYKWRVANFQFDIIRNGDNMIHRLF